VCSSDLTLARESIMAAKVVHKVRPALNRLEGRDVPSTTYFAVGGTSAGGTQVNVFDAETGALVGSFSAFESSYNGGGALATGGVNGDGIYDIIVGAASGGAPRVRVLDGATVATGNPTVLADFFAYESTFRGGVHVAAGDVNGDGREEILAGAGNGGAPRLRVLDATTLAVGADPRAIEDFFAYESTFRGGVNVGAGDFNGDGRDDIIAGSGVGGAPRVRILDAVTGAALEDFFAFSSDLRNGVSVGAGDLNGDGRVDLVAGAGPGGGMEVRMFDATTDNELGHFYTTDRRFEEGVQLATIPFGGNKTNVIMAGTDNAEPAIQAFDVNGIPVYYSGGGFQTTDSTQGGLSVG